MPIRRVDRFVAPRTSSSAVLRQGSRGAQVKTLQNLLRAKGYRISADGAFGARTAAAVRAFQKRAHLAADGVVGPKTWAALRGGSASSSRTGRAAKVSVQSSGPGVAATGYRKGRPVRIRIASVGNGKSLNTRAAGSYKSMLAAARRAGIRLTTVSGYRTYAQQSHLYRLYKSGRGNLAARPGYSNHQMGLAADIGGIGGYNTRAYRWLRANAGRYGFVNDVRGEPWHWTYRR